MLLIRTKLITGWKEVTRQDALGQKKRTEKQNWRLWEGPLCLQDRVCVWGGGVCVYIYTQLMKKKPLILETSKCCSQESLEKEKNEETYT